MHRIFYYAMAILLLGGTVLQQVYFSGSTKKKQNELLAEAIKSLDDFPSTVGDWKAVEDHEFSKREIQMLSLAGYVNRSYRNQLTHEIVTIVLFIGPGGTLVVHTPEVCFTGRFFKIDGEPERVDMSLGKDQQHGVLRRTLFKSNSQQGNKLLVYYGWSRGTEGWTVPDQPRWTLGSEPLLYKIHVGAVVPNSVRELSDDNPCHRFLEAFLPIVQERVLSHAPQK